MSERHFMEGDTGVTNFHPNQVPIFAATIEETGRTDLFILPRPMSGIGPPGDYSLHRRGSKPLDLFWQMFRLNEKDRLFELGHVK